MPESSPIAVITDASGPFSESTASALAREGYAVVGFAHENLLIDPKETSFIKIITIGGQIESTIKTAIAHIIADYNRIDLVVNNVRFGPSDQPDGGLETLPKNLGFVLSLLKHTVPFLKVSKNPFIINLFSSEYTSYEAAAITGLFTAFSSESAASRVQVKNIKPAADERGGDLVVESLALNQQKPDARTEPKRILFYTSPFGELDTFSAHAVELDGIIYPTVEHAFQVNKCTNPEGKAAILAAKSPGEAKSLSNGEFRQYRNPQWTEVKIAVMERALRAKAAQHPDVHTALMNSGVAELIEDSPTDYFWGQGADGTGRNVLGKLWMKIRAEYAGKGISQQDS